MFEFIKKLFTRPNPPALIEIDDSGAGSLYGGIVIFLTDGKNDFFREIHLKYFAIKNDHKRKQSIRNEILNIIRSGLKKLNARPKTTKLVMCQGNYFDFPTEFLRKKGYDVERKKIMGRTNTFAEEAFNHLLEHKYNIPDYNSKDYRGENLRQYDLLKKRRDFKNVKINSRGVTEIIKGQQNQ